MLFPMLQKKALLKPFKKGVQWGAPPGLLPPLGEIEGHPPNSRQEEANSQKNRISTEPKKNLKSRARGDT